MGFSLRQWFVNIGKRYLVLTLWLVVCALLFWRTYNEFKYDPQFFYVHQMLGSWLCMSRASAAVLNLNCGLVLVPMCRTFVTFLRNIQRKVGLGTMANLLDACKGFHIACAYVICILSVIHISGHMINARNFSKYYNPVYADVNGVMYKDQDPMMVVVATVPGITGLIMMIILCVIFTTSIKYTRTANYDLFWYIHRLVAVFYILLLVHAFRGPIRRQINLDRHYPGCEYGNMTIPFPEPIPEPEAEYYAELSQVCDEGPKFDYIGCQSWMWILVPGMLYLCDTAIRLFKRTPTVSVINVNRLGDDVLEIQFEKENFTARPGQFVYVQCPDISTFEWHPYSLTTCPLSPGGHHSIHVRAIGDWSGDLLSYIVSLIISAHVLVFNEKTFHSSCSHLLIDGPFSSPMEDVTKYRTLLCVAGGIGLTPFIAFLNAIRHQTLKLGKLSRICLVWMNRDIRSFLWFTGAIRSLHATLWEERPDLLDIRYHYTGQHSARDSIVADLFFFKRLRYGRPIWKDLFHEFAANRPRETIGVFTCGPRSLAHIMKRQCNKKYSSGTKFDFYQECF
ncbi:hypothetical protein ScPMuIL_012671 [Solemya velum]